MHSRDAAQRMAAKLRPRVIVPRAASSNAARAAGARGRQLQPLVGWRVDYSRTSSATAGVEDSLRTKEAWMRFIRRR